MHQHKTTSAGQSNAVTGSAGKGGRTLPAVPVLRKKQSTVQPAIQLKEETELKPGFNMIGESHTDFPGENARRYEARQIKTVLGNGTKYFTEGLLKTDESDSDYADPIHMRLEQAIAFIKRDCGDLMPDLKMIRLLDLEESLKKEKKHTGDIGLIVKDIAPKILDEQWTEEAIVEYIKKQNYSIELLKKLSVSDNWDFQKVYDPEYNHSGKFFSVLDLIADEQYRREDELDNSDEEVKPIEVDPLEMYKSGVIRVQGFYTEFKGRLPTSLKLYFNLRDKGKYTGKGHFNFTVRKIPAALAQWDKIERLSGLIKELLDGKRYDVLPMAIDRSIAILSDLLDALDAGMEEKDKGKKVVDVKVARSIAMHKAAEAMKGENIAWKVGNLHVLDIKDLEEQETIETNYTYIQKEVFNDNYLDFEAMKNYTGSDNDVGEAYVKGKKQQKTMMDTAKERLRNLLPWEFNYSAIQHLNLPNLITNQTHVIVEAVENGMLPKLKKLTIHEKSMTTDLRGRLLSCGVEIVLVR